MHKESPRLLEVHGGFGELTEDHLEQSHQMMDKVHQRLGRLGFGPKPALAISRIVKSKTNPKLRAAIEQVIEDRKRRFQKPSVGEKKRKVRITNKKERRSSNLVMEKTIVKDEKVIGGHEGAKRTKLARDNVH